MKNILHVERDRSQPVSARSDGPGKRQPRYRLFAQSSVPQYFIDYLRLTFIDKANDLHLPASLRTAQRILLVQSRSANRLTMEGRAILPNKIGLIESIKSIICK